MYKIIVLLLFVTLSMFANNKFLVPVSKKHINWKSVITSNHIYLSKINQKYKCKKYLDINTLKKNQYRAKHFILKNTALCSEDVYKSSNKKISFNFGSLEIEKNAELIKETDTYIKIKNPNGKIEKIYKNGSEN